MIQGYEVEEATQSDDRSIQLPSLPSVGDWRWPNAFMAHVEFPPLAQDEHGPRSYVYFVQAEKSLAIKIGISTNVAARFSSLCTGNHEKLRLVCWTEGGDVKERALHKRFAEYRIHYEWFNPGPRLVDFIHTVLRGEEY